MRITALALAVALWPALMVRAAAPPAPAPAKEAAARMTLPPGFQATLFAGEPDVVQPISFAFDDRGRLWVAECLSYPRWVSDPKAGHDRLTIFEDADGDGHFSKRTVFADNLANVSGVEVGFGGVWVCSTPNLIFIPFKEGEDKPSGEPQIVLDGWGFKGAQHNVFNRIVWGPDGWLYGLNGIQSKSTVGKPGTPADKRTPLNCGVWRYHPTRGTFEAVAHGTTNPWGLDWDERGQMFITNCVIEHLWHVIPGGHYKRMYGEDVDPHTFGLIQTCADHIHWAGGSWTTSRGGEGAHGTAGGGHAHAGAMVYLGDNWPAQYRDTVFTCNIHGNRVNNDLPEHKGSGYVVHHGKDFLFANDPWFRGLALDYGPDGGVIVSDWCDTGECHNHVVVDQSTGRLFKVTYGKPPAVRVDLSRRGDPELVDLQLHKNDWFVRHARRLLQERAAAGTLAQTTKPALLKVLRENPDATRKLRALWALHAVGGVDETLTLELLGGPDEYLRGWAIQLALEGRESPRDALRDASPALLEKLAGLAKGDPSPVVRLYLASGLQRLPLAQRWAIVEGLLSHAEDAGDANLPLMIWYGTEPLVKLDAPRALGLGAKSKVPLVREYIVRRMAS